MSIFNPDNADVRALRDSEGCGLMEAKRRLKKEKMKKYLENYVEPSPLKALIKELIEDY